MTFDPKQRDDFDYGKRIYRQKPKGKPPYLLVSILVVVLAGIILLILHKKSMQDTYVPGFDADDSPGMSETAVSHVENSKEDQQDSITPGETFPGTGPYTDTDPGTTYPSIDERIYGDIKSKKRYMERQILKPGPVSCMIVPNNIVRRGSLKKHFPCLRNWRLRMTGCPCLWVFVITRWEITRMRVITCKKY
jgi:hypothetical protein